MLGTAVFKKERSMETLTARAERVLRREASKMQVLSQLLLEMVFFELLFRDRLVLNGRS